MNFQEAFQEAWARTLAEAEEYRVRRLEGKKTDYMPKRVGRPVTTGRSSTKVGPIDVPAWMKAALLMKTKREEVSMAQVIRHSILLYLRGELDVPADD